jgi:hypothetical protein
LNDGDRIYPLEEKIMAFKGFVCTINGVAPAEYLSGRETVKITLYADPTPIIKGETEMFCLQTALMLW